MTRAARLALRVIAALWLFCLAAALLGCGGGDPEPEPQSGTHPPDCQAHPEQCR